jgi:protein-S-isoprenylcysteine O-methyltransferase Ste14
MRPKGVPGTRTTITEELQMSHNQPGYGLWMLVILNSAIFLMFAFSFFKPQTGRDWRTFGAFAAFVIALFVEMYGFPLTIYLMSGWLQTKYPNLDLLSHNSGHLWSTMLGEKGDPHFGVLHIASYAFLGLGFYLLSAAWNVLYQAQRANRLATTGPYARIRHPQYVAFVMILLGFLLQWPTLLTLVMFPILVAMYGRLAVTEEREMRARFGAEFDAYAARTPRFVPALGSRASAA